MDHIYNLDRKIEEEMCNFLLRFQETAYLVVFQLTQEQIGWYFVSVNPLGEEVRHSRLDEVGRHMPTRR